MYQLEKNRLHIETNIIKICAYEQARFLLTHAKHSMQNDNRFCSLPLIQIQGYVNGREVSKLSCKQVNVPVHKYHISFVFTTDLQGLIFIQGANNFSLHTC